MTLQVSDTVSQGVPIKALLEHARPDELMTHLLRADFPSFLRRCFETLNPTTTYAFNWHLAAICCQLERVRLGQCKRLIIAMPPRSLKSICTSVSFPAYLHGQDPSTNIIAVSYSQDLAIKHHNDYRCIMASDWYFRTFPNSRISVRKDTEYETELIGRGTRLSTSPGGTLTGRGADVIIIDDPLKPYDAHSELKRGQVNEWYGSSLVSRLNDKANGAIIVVAQRLHIDDLIGHLCAQYGEDWTVLTLPAIATHGETIELGNGRVWRRSVGDLLHPARENQQTLDRLRAELGAATFDAQYQQSPVPPGGAMFKRDWIKRYDVMPAITKGDMIVQSWDTASKTGPANDWSVCSTWLRREGLHFLLNVERVKLDYPALKTRAIYLARSFDARIVLVEDNGVGTGLIAELAQAGINAIGRTPVASKEARASVQSAVFEAGRVVLPSSAPWLSDLEAELFAFPGSRHDDQVDSITQALEYSPPPTGGARRIRL